MMTPTTTDAAKRPATRSRSLVISKETNKHEELCKQLRRNQVADLAKVSEHGTGILNWFQTTLSDLAYYLFVWFPRTWWITLTSLPSFLLDPVGLYSTLVFAIGTTVMLFVSLIVSAVWRLPAVQRIWRPYSAKKNVGLGNLAYPLIFEFGADPQNQKIRDIAFDVMSYPTNPLFRPSTAEARTFDLEVSKILMMLSALVYERDVGAYEDAARSVHHAKNMNKTFLLGEKGLTEAGKDAYAKLSVADRKINQVANEWGLNYASVSELATNTSPLCGAFWHPDYNFLILAFKGTDPVEFKEWAIDFTFDYTDGRAWLPGFTKVHAGFYNQIFPQRLNHATGAFPYTEIRSAVKEIVKEIRATSFSDHVNLYVTGHSLGAALASMFYSRAVASPKDFGETEEGGQQVYIRDAYCFGTPIVGDPDCISAFNQSIHDRDLDNPQSLWRVTNRRDAVATLLPDFGDYNTLRHISPTSQLHFAHVGQEIQLGNNARKVWTGPGTLLPTQTPVNIISHLDKGGEGPDVELPAIFWLLERIPIVRRVVAHLPSCYWDRLTKVHQEFDIEYARWH